MKIPNDGKVWKDTPENAMTILEDALVVCKFGRFHVKLMFATLISVLATTSVTTASSYILPNAECDLNMSMRAKGLLNAIPFVGQVCATLFTGFITDAFGRKIFLVWGNFGMFLFALLGASSQNYLMLVVVKLFEGVIMSVCFTATATMVTEFTHKDVRDRVLLLYSSFMSLSVIISALIAWALVHWSFNFVIIGGYFVLHSWNIYLYVCAIWSLIAALIYWSLPESPKFLLTHGQENEALEVLKNIYHTNTGNHKQSFPIKSLNVAGIFKPTSKISIKKQLVNALSEAKELLKKPNLNRLILFSCITFVCLLAYSALRLWFPQLSTIVENYKKDGNNSVKFCDIIDSYSRNKNSAVKDANDAICVPQISGAETYTNGIILGFISLTCITMSGYLVDRFGQKLLMFIFLIFCAICSSCLYWTNSSIQIAILVSATCGFMQTAFSLQHNILVRVFPTTVRTLTLSIVIMVGRIGSLVGNIIFPFLLEISCMVPFIALSVITMGVASIIYLLPNPRTENKTGDK